MSEIINENRKSDIIILVTAMLSIVLSFILIQKNAHVNIPLGKGFAVPETCFIKSFTGIRCPTCGLTRSFMAISHADFRQSIAYNSGGIVAYVYVLFQLPYRLLRLFKKRELHILKKINLYFTVFTAAILIISWVAYLLSIKGL